MLISTVTLGIGITLLALPWTLPARKTKQTAETDCFSASSTNPPQNRESGENKTRWQKIWNPPNLPTLEPSVVLDLAGAGLQAGCSIPHTLHSIGQASQLPELSQISKALLLGVPWEVAWQLLPNKNPPAWAKPLKHALEPAWKNGVAPEGLLTGQVKELRNRKDQRAKEAAQKLAVKLTLPLGLCQLPAFILLGIVPNVLGGIRLL